MKPDTDFVPFSIMLPKDVANQIKTYLEEGSAVFLLWRGPCPECKKLVTLLMVTKG